MIFLTNLPQLKKKKNPIAWCEDIMPPILFNFASLTISFNFTPAHDKTF